MDIFIKFMDKLMEYYMKVEAWIKLNPGKATLIGIFAAGLIIGAILF